MILDDQNIIDLNIEDSLKKSYLDYAMSVIIGRALPDARDGLKPVHRRVLFSMHEMGLRYNKRYLKSARVVGDVIGKYHPHGDTAIYDTLVRMAQEFSLRYPLVDGQGNFGSIDGDAAAAMRYTEAKMMRITDELLQDIDNDTVDFAPTYDDVLEEPTVLPTKIPNLLVNGSSGIAVGMATNIPPHNLTEIIDALLLMVDNPDYTEDEILSIVTGPDFPTRGFILGKEGITKAYKTGRGSVKLRSRTNIEIDKSGRERIIVTEIPYQVNKSTMIERMAELARDKVITGISDLRDESDKDGIRVVIEIKRNDAGQVVLNQLFKYTQLETSFGINMVAIVNGRPKVMNLIGLLEEFKAHRVIVVRRRTEFFLRKANDRLHLIEGLRTAVSNIDEVVSIIRTSADTPEAKRRLKERFSLSDIQAQAILDMRLAKITSLEIDKLNEEYQEILKNIEYLMGILNSREVLMGVVRDELAGVKEAYGDDRRTEIIPVEGEISMEDLVADDNAIITFTHYGYIKRMPSDAFQSQRRGGKGKMSSSTSGDGEDFVTDVIHTTNHTKLFIFTNQGRVHYLKAYEISEMGRVARGRHISNSLSLNEDERIVSILPLTKDIMKLDSVVVTKNGMIKRSPFSVFKSERSGIRGINLRDGDEIIGHVSASEDSYVFIATRQGKSIQFKLSDVRAIGRVAQGVRGIALSEGDAVVSINVATQADQILTVTENGYGKRSSLDDYRLQARGGQGTKLSNVTEKTGEIVGANVVAVENDLVLVSKSGKLIKLNVGEISLLGRATQGVKLMSTGGDSIITFAVLPPGIDDDGEDEDDGNGNGNGDNTSS